MSRIGRKAGRFAPRDSLLQTVITPEQFTGDQKAGRSEIPSAAAWSTCKRKASLLAGVSARSMRRSAETPERSETVSNDRWLSDVQILSEVGTKHLPHELREPGFGGEGASDARRQHAVAGKN